MPARAVLDASAIVAILFKERGHEALLAVVAVGVVVTPTGLAEALEVARRRGHRNSADELADDLGRLGVEIEPMLLEDGLVAAEMMAAFDRQYPGGKKDGTDVGRLSLGDASCMAVAHRLDLPVVASDGAWEIFTGGLTVHPFR